MRNRVGIVFVLAFSSLALSGCLMNTAGGPCYGFGCGAMTGAPAGAPQNAMYQENGPTVASNNTAAEEAKATDGKQHGMKSFFKNLLPSQHTDVAPATAAPAAPAAAGN